MGFKPTNLSVNNRALYHLATYPMKIKARGFKILALCVKGLTFISTYIQSHTTCEFLRSGDTSTYKYNDFLSLDVGDTRVQLRSKNRGPPEFRV